MMPELVYGDDAYAASMGMSEHDYDGCICDTIPWGSHGTCEDCGEIRCRAWEEISERYICEACWESTQARTFGTGVEEGSPDAMRQDNGGANAAH